MNNSKYINADKCRTCGKCCKTFSICYPKSIEKEDPIMFSEVNRFKMLDTDFIEVIEKEDFFLVKFNFPCKYLIKSDKGIYSCVIYKEGRPELCKSYPFEETIDCPFKLNNKKTSR